MMRRHVLCASTLALLPLLTSAQTRSATPPVTPDKAETVAGIQILALRPTMFMMVSPEGGNSVVQVGDQGVLVVDTMTVASGEALVSAIRRVSERPILQVINTSSDADHVGGNEAVRKAGAYFSTANTRDGGGAGILAFEQTLHRMSVDGSPFPRYGWPTDTFFVKQKDFSMNGEPVQVMHQPAAHTDGDVLVLFRKNDVIAAGDVFTPDRFPSINLQQGGSIDGLIAGLNRILELAVPEFNEEGGTLVVPGHGRLCDEADVSDYRDMVTIVRDRVRDMVSKKATLEQVKMARPTADYDAVYGSAQFTGEMFVEAVYRSLTPPVAAPATPRGGRR